MIPTTFLSQFPMTIPSEALIATKTTARLLIFHWHLLPFRVYHLLYHLTMHHLFNQIYYPPIFFYSNLQESFLSFFSLSFWFQSTAEPSESLLITTLTLESSPLIMPTIRFIQAVTHSAMTHTVSQLSWYRSHWESGRNSTYESFYGWSASKRRNLKSVLASIGVSGVVAFHEVGMYSTSGKSTMYIYFKKNPLIEVSIWRSFSGSALARNQSHFLQYRIR